LAAVKQADREARAGKKRATGTPRGAAKKTAPRKRRA
jgi:hypothetical protein